MKFAATDLWSGLRKDLNPATFLLGALLGFLLCCQSGRLAAGKNSFQNFRRFHFVLQPGTAFCPTVSQMIAIAKEPLVEGKTLVIIGGNSVGYGVKQGEGLWSEKLANILGPSYAVRNFATNGNYSPYSGPYFAFLSLSRTFNKIYYVTFSRPGIQGDIEDPFYGNPYYWDARYKNLLPEMKNVEKEIRQRNDGAKGADRQRIDEDMLGSRLDSVFFFRDLWTTVAYTSFSTVWMRGTNNFLLPRSAYPDVDKPLEGTTLARFARLDLPSELNNIKFRFRSFFGDAEANDAIPNSEFRNNLEEQIRSPVPKSLRDRIVQVNVRNCPYFLNKLSADDMKKYKLMSAFNRTTWLKSGFRQLDVGADYQDDDYIDAFHLSRAGAAKLAQSVADALLSKNDPR